MTQKDILDKIEPLLEKLAVYRKTLVMELKPEELSNLREVIVTIAYGYVDVNLSCPTCVMEYLAICESYYQREKPKYDAFQRAEEQGKMIFIKQDEGVAPMQDQDIVNALTGKVAPEEPKVEEAKAKLSRAEILARARAARKQDQNPKED